MWERFDRDLQNAVYYAQKHAQSDGSSSVTAKHLHLGLIRDPEAMTSQILDTLNTEVSSLEERIIAIPDPEPHTTGGDMTLSPGAKSAVSTAINLMRTQRSPNVSHPHLFLGLLETGNGPVEDLYKTLGVTYDSVLEVVSELEQSCNPNSKSSEVKRFSTSWQADQALDRAAAFVKSHEGSLTEILPCHVALVLAQSPPHPLRVVFNEFTINSKTLEQELLSLCDQTPAPPHKQVNRESIDKILEVASELTTRIDSVVLFLAAGAADQHVRGEIEEATGLPFDDFVKRVEEFRKTQDY